jgi:prepilin peptidase CpaA
MDAIQWVQFGTPLLAGAIAGVTDAWKYKVYNWLTFPLILGGVLFHAMTFAEGGWAGACYSLSGITLGFVVLLVFHLMGGIGAGDVKLMAGFGAWLGWQYTLELFLIAAVVMGIYSIGLLLFFGGFRKLRDRIMIAIVQIQTQSPTSLFNTSERIEDAVKDAERRKKLVPFAVCAFVGVVWIFVLCGAMGMRDGLLKL